MTIEPDAPDHHPGQRPTELLERRRPALAASFGASGPPDDGC